MVKSDLRIDILGTAFSITADKDIVYLEKLLHRYRLAIENTQRATGIKDPLKSAILTGFLLCDELEKFKTRESEEKGLRDNEARAAEQLTQDIINRISDILEGEA
jgi:hypothetical protein